MVLDPPDRRQWMSSVLCPYPTAFIPCVHLGEQWCAPSVVMYGVLADDSIYEGLSLVGNFRIIARVGIGIIIYYAG